MLRSHTLTFLTLFATLSLGACISEDELLDSELEALLEADELDEEIVDDEVGNDDLEIDDSDDEDSDEAPTLPAGPDTLSPKPIPCDPPLPPLEIAIDEDQAQSPIKPLGYDASEVPDADDDCEEGDEDCEDSE